MRIRQQTAILQTHARLYKGAFHNGSDKRRGSQAKIREIPANIADEKDDFPSREKPNRIRKTYIKEKDTKTITK